MLSSSDVTRVDLAGLTTRIVGPSRCADHGRPPATASVHPATIWSRSAADHRCSGALRVSRGAARARRAVRRLARVVAARSRAPRGRAPPRHPARLPRGDPRWPRRPRATTCPALLDQLEARYSRRRAQLVLGGFSQGAMLVARCRAPSGRAARRLAPDVGHARRRVRVGAAVHRTLAGMPILQSHGRSRRRCCRSAIAEILRDRLSAAGAQVDWHQFVGGHEIPPTVLDAASRFLRARATARTALDAGCTAYRRGSICRAVRAAVLVGVDAHARALRRLVVRPEEAHLVVRRLAELDRLRCVVFVVLALEVEAAVLRHAELRARASASRGSAHSNGAGV